jgi:hypothetical protein
MKRLALVAAVLTLAACATKEEAPAVDTAAPPAMAPAPAADTAAMKMDSAMKDTTAKKP